MRIICLLDIVQKNSLCLLPQYTATMNECQILSVLKHRKGISQETWCQLPRLNWHFSNTVLIDVLTFTSSATGNSIHQKNTNLPVHRHQQGCSIHLQLFKGWYKTCWWIQALRRNTGHQGQTCRVIGAAVCFFTATRVRNKCPLGTARSLLH